MKNRNLIEIGLKSIYSTERLKGEKSKFYLTWKQIEGILYYIENYFDSPDIEIEQYIDNQIINEYGFDELGFPIEEEEEEQEE